MRFLSSSALRSFISLLTPPTDLPNSPKLSACFFVYSSIFSLRAENSLSVSSSADIRSVSPCITSSRFSAVCLSGSSSGVSSACSSAASAASSVGSVSASGCSSPASVPSASSGFSSGASSGCSSSERCSKSFSRSSSLYCSMSFATCSAVTFFFSKSPILIILLVYFYLLVCLWLPLYFVCLLATVPLPSHSD